MSEVLSEKSFLTGIRNLDPFEFEKLIGELWERQGYETTVRRRSKDRGIDVIATQGPKKELIQVKRYSAKNKIGSQKVREYATLYLQDTDADKVIIVTSGFFTNEAKALGKDLEVKLINGERLYRLLKEHASGIAVEYLSENVLSQVSDPVKGNPFTNKHKFSRITDEQGLFDSCPECSRGRIWLGQLKSNNRIRLKCGLCNAGWKEKREGRGWWNSGREKNVGWEQTSGGNLNNLKADVFDGERFTKKVHKFDPDHTGNRLQSGNDEGQNLQEKHPGLVLFLILSPTILCFLYLDPFFGGLSTIVAVYVSYKVEGAEVDDDLAVV